MQEKIIEYARLIVETGVNLQKGQKVLICCPVECADFARILTDIAYEDGAADVLLEWRDDHISRAHWMCADDSLFDSVYQWKADMRNSLAKEKTAYIFIVGDDPENLKGVDPERLRRYDVASGRDLKYFYDMETSNGFPWCVAAVPVKRWADTVFPDAENSMQQLWDAIFKTVRITGDGKAPEKWKEHCNNLRNLAEKLNKLNLESLHYENTLGTDLTVELPENHNWLSGGDVTQDGVPFVANMPTEEVFGAPKKTGVNGKLCASMPLVLNGNIVEGIVFTFKDGRIEDIHADSGEELLRAAVEADEGAHYLGEVALVPYDSPISNSKILFYETLFDENASCHFAFGQAYSGCIKGGDFMKTEELIKAGINAESCTHIDFMVGTSDLSITGKTRDGREVKIFEKGNFAI